MPKTNSNNGCILCFGVSFVDFQNCTNGKAEEVLCTFKGEFRKIKWTEKMQSNLINCPIHREFYNMEIPDGYCQWVYICRYCHKPVENQANPLMEENLDVVCDKCNREIPFCCGNGYDIVETEFFNFRKCKSCEFM